MPKTFRPYAADQMMLLPSSVREWVPEGDMAHFISDIVDALDLSEIEAVYEEEMRGYPPYHPRMMTKLWLYAYAVGIRSCRKLARLATRDVGCMMLAAGNRPDFRTLNSFRLRHLAALGGLFQPSLCTGHTPAGRDARASRLGPAISTSVGSGPSPLRRLGSRKAAPSTTATWRGQECAYRRSHRRRAHGTWRRRRTRMRACMWVAFGRPELPAPGSR